MCTLSERSCFYVESMFAYCNFEINTCFLSLRIGAAMISDCWTPKFIIYITATAF